MKIPTTDTQKILDAVLGLQASVSRLETRMDGLDSRQDEMIEVIQSFATDVDGRFTQIDQRFTQIDQRFDRVDERLDHIEKEQTRMRSVMVDKDYLDRKFLDFKADIFSVFRKGDQRVNTLVSTLKRKRTLTGKEADDILARPAFVPSRP